MNFYRFVNSRDIRAHLQSINYVFTATEAAWLVWQSMYATLEDKHRAWEYIIANMPDCPIPERLNTVPQPSLHRFLQELMELQKSRLQKPSIWWLRYNECGEVIDIADHGKVTAHEWDLVHNVFAGMWFAFPTPFKRGDIVKDCGTYGEVFVLDELSADTGRERLERFGDATDMTAYGYFVDADSGDVYYECMHNYMRLEYCRDELTGPERVLYTVSTELRAGREPVGTESQLAHWEEMV